MSLMEWYLVFALATGLGCWVHHADRKNSEKRKAEQLFRSLDERKLKDIE